MCPTEGPWSDKSAEWKNVSDAERLAAGFVSSDEDGEFWFV